MKTYIDNIVEQVQNELHIKNLDLAKLYALLVLTKEENITLKDVHDAWSVSMNYRKQTEYCPGHEHRSLVPFDELSKETQQKDKKYKQGLIKIAKQLKTN